MRPSQKQSGRERKALGIVPHRGCGAVEKEAGIPGGTRSGVIES